MAMMQCFALVVLPLLCQGMAPISQPAVLGVMPEGVQLGSETQKQTHLGATGCLNACRPSLIESKCITACEASMYKCIDHTGLAETPQDTEACQAKVLKESEASQEALKWQVEALKKEDERAQKKSQSKGMSFLQLGRNIDDANAEAAEMARLEAQSDKDMGEEDDEAKSGAAEESDSSTDEESFVQVKRNIDDDNAEAAEMARLEAQSDKDMGEENDPTVTTTNDDSDKSDNFESFVQAASKKVAKKGDGFDGFGAPDPFNQNDDDQVDAGEPNAPDQVDPNDDANMVSDDDANDDDSLVQVSSKKAGEKTFLGRF